MNSIIHFFQKYLFFTCFKNILNRQFTFVHPALQIPDFSLFSTCTDSTNSDSAKSKVTFYILYLNISTV